MVSARVVRAVSFAAPARLAEGIRLERAADVRVLASPKNWIDGAAAQQLERTAALPGMRLAVGLPDLHPGRSSPIGAAFLVEDCLYPALVGNDIGRGIGLWRTTLDGRRPRHEAWARKLRGPVRVLQA